jgi:hypothetical protein
MCIRGVTIKFSYENQRSWHKILSWEVEGVSIKSSDGNSKELVLTPLMESQRS